MVQPAPIPGSVPSPAAPSPAAKPDPAPVTLADTGPVTLQGDWPANASRFADSRLPGPLDTAPEDGLEPDMAHALQAVGLVSLRAALVDPDTLSPSRHWALHTTVAEGAAGGDMEGAKPAGAEARADAAFPGAAVLVSRLQHDPTAETLSLRLSPRRWVLAWQIDARRVGLALAHFDSSHVALAPADSGLVRLVCDAGLRASAALPAAPPPAPLSWPAVERRARLAPRWVTWPSLLLLGLAALLSAWLTWVALPEQRETTEGQQAELARLHAMADSTVSRAVTVALATGDYGEVQSALDGFASLGYFEQALVTNPRDRTVAWVGHALGARIGDPPPPALLQRAVSITLVQGREPIGRLLLARSPAVMGLLPGIASLQWPAGLVMALACGALLLLALRWPQRQRKPR